MKLDEEKIPFSWTYVLNMLWDEIGRIFQCLD